MEPDIDDLEITGSDVEDSHVVRILLQLTFKSMPGDLEIVAFF